MCRRKQEQVHTERHQEGGQEELGGAGGVRQQLVEDRQEFADRDRSLFYHHRLLLYLHIRENQIRPGWGGNQGPAHREARFDPIPATLLR